VDKVTIAFIRERGNVFQPVFTIQSIDQPTAGFFTFAVNHKIDIGRLGGGRNLFGHQCGMISTNHDFYIRQLLLYEFD